MSESTPANVKTETALVERLRRRHRRYDYTSGCYGPPELTNPDGPEAADRIERLEAALQPFASLSWGSGVTKASFNKARAALNQS